MQRPPQLRCGYTTAMLSAFVFRPRLWRTPAGSSTPFCGCVLLGGGPTKAPTRYGLSPRVSFCRRRGCFDRVPSNARVWRSGVSSFLGLVEGSWSGVTLPLPWQAGGREDRWCHEFAQLVSARSILRRSQLKLGVGSAQPGRGADVVIYRFHRENQWRSEITPRLGRF